MTGPFLVSLACAGRRELGRARPRWRATHHLAGRTFVRLGSLVMDRPRNHELEIERRSIAMLTPGAWALRREAALRLRSALAERDDQLAEARIEVAALLARLNEFD